MTQSNRRTEIESWWALVARILLTVLGGVLVAYLVLTDSTVVWAYLAGIALCGPTVAISVATMLEAMRGASGD